MRAPRPRVAILASPSADLLLAAKVNQSKAALSASASPVTGPARVVSRRSPSRVDGADCEVSEGNFTPPQMETTKTFV